MHHSSMAYSMNVSVSKRAPWWDEKSKRQPGSATSGWRQAQVSSYRADNSIPTKMYGAQTTRASMWSDSLRTKVFSSIHHTAPLAAVSAIVPGGKSPRKRSSPWSPLFSIVSISHQARNCPRNFLDSMSARLPWELQVRPKGWIFSWI